MKTDEDMKKLGIAQASNEQALAEINKHGSVMQAWGRRYLRMKDGKLSFITKLYSPIFEQDKFLPPAAEMTVDLTANTPEFCLLGSGDVNELQIRFDHLSLLVPMAQMTPAFVESQAYFNHKTKKPPITYKVKQYEIYPKGFGPKPRI